MKTLPFQLKLTLTPLLLSLAIGQAYAADVVVTGAAGVAGTPGAQPDGDGGAGTAGASATHTLSTSGATGKLTVIGGRGGEGGIGATEEVGPDNPGMPRGGRGGEGGAGGAASGSLTVTHNSGNAVAETIAEGGAGGTPGMDGCCQTGTGEGGKGGDAASYARAAATTASATVRASATGGNGEVSRNGGAATATGIGSAVGAATGQVRAVGGQGGSGRASGNSGLTSNPGSGGNASATLELVAGGIASGDVEAVGGNGASAYVGNGSGGVATSSLSLRGAGASGTSTATNGYGQGSRATSLASAETTGLHVVDLTAYAHGSQLSGSRAEVTVDSGYYTAPAGNADVTGRAYADGGPGGDGPNYAAVTLQGAGNINGLSEARGNDGWDTSSCYAGCAPGADASASSFGITSQGTVTISALAVGGAEVYDNFLPGGAARAVASGNSGNGAVAVRASASSRDYGSTESYASALGTARGAGNAAYVEARHTARFLPFRASSEASALGGGESTAIAIGNGSGGTLSARARTDGMVEQQVGSRVEVSTATGNTTAIAGTRFNGSVYTVPALDAGALAVSYAQAGLSASNTNALVGLAPALAAAPAAWNGAGVMAISGGDTPFINATTESTFQLSAATGEHLVLGLIGGQSYGTGIYSVAFSVTSGSVVLFTRTLANDELSAFFTNHYLDLGAVQTAGWNSLVVSADWAAGAGGGYGFNYVVGTAPVPEPSTWLAMLLGLGTLVMAVRRRQA